MLALTATSAPALGPAIELPVETTTTAIELGTGDVPDHVLVRGLQEERQRGAGTVLGSYGEFNLTYLSIGPDAPYDGTATVRRLVLFVAHNFSDEFRGYIELEWENAVACSRCNGSVEVEQAFVEWKLGVFDLTLRGGLVLVPFGIVNQWHEPTVFHGVERPRVDQLIVPTTWRELGVGGSFTPFESAKVELYLMTAPDALQLGPAGLAQARTLGSLAPANSFLVSGRFELEPLLGFVTGLSAIAGDLGGGDRFFDAGGQSRDLSLPLVGLGLDARWRRSGIEARIFGAMFLLPNAGDLMNARRADGSPLFPPGSGAVATRILGGYAELAYDVLRALATTTHQLLPFARIEKYDSQSAVPDGFDRDPRFGVLEYTFGLSYRPIQQVAVKLDYQLRDRRLGLDEKQLNLALGYVF
jgi:hypothetical protein